MRRPASPALAGGPWIELLTAVEVDGLSGDERLEQVSLKHPPTGTRETRLCPSLLCFIGAQPTTGWLADQVLLDAKGFVLTDRQLPDAVDGAATGALPFEISVRGQLRSRVLAPATAPTRLSQV